MTDPLFHVVLHEPEIPNNTGNIGRTCVATGCALHLIHPLGFETSEKECRRAGLDYWPRLGVCEHQSWASYENARLAASPHARDASERPRSWFLTTKATRTVFDATFKRGDHLVFGKESAGLPDEILKRHAEWCVTLPMVPSERSLNLATAVCAVVYEGVRQLLARGDVTLGEAGRLVLR